MKRQPHLFKDRGGEGRAKGRDVLSRCDGNLSVRTAVVTGGVKQADLCLIPTHANPPSYEQ